MVSRRLKMSFKVQLEQFCQHIFQLVTKIRAPFSNYCSQLLLKRFNWEKSKVPIGIRTREPFVQFDPYSLQKVQTLDHSVAARYLATVGEPGRGDREHVEATQDVRSAIVRCPARGRGWGEDVGVGGAGCRPQPVADHIPTSPEKAHINGGQTKSDSRTRSRAFHSLSQPVSQQRLPFTLSLIYRLPTIRPFNSPIISVMFVQDLLALKTGFRSCRLYDRSWADYLRFIHPFIRSTYCISLQHFKERFHSFWKQCNNYLFFN